MTVIPYDFTVFSSAGVAQTGIVFSVTGLASPGFSALYKKPTALGGANTNITPSSALCTVIENGHGSYTLYFDADAQGGDCTAILDAGSGLTPDANRYIVVPLNRDSSRIITDLDATVSSRNTGAVTLAAGQTVATVTAISAGGLPQADLTTALTTQGLTTTRAAKLDSLDATVSSRLAAGSYVAPDTGAAIAADILNATALSYNTAGTVGNKINAIGGSGGATATQIATAVWQDLLASTDFTTAASVGAKLASLLLDGTGRVTIAPTDATASRVATALPNAAPGALGGLPTVNASNQVDIDLQQQITTDEKLGAILQGDEAQGAGVWKWNKMATPPTLQLYQADGTTLVRTFNLTLDASGNITQRG